MEAEKLNSEEKNGSAGEIISQGSFDMKAQSVE